MCYNQTGDISNMKSVKRQQVKKAIDYMEIRPNR